MNAAPLATPWGSIVLLVLGLALFYAAGAVDTGPPRRFRRVSTRFLVVLSGVSLAGSLVAAVLG